MSAPEPRTCQVCGGAVLLLRQSFCSDRCRQTAHRARSSRDRDELLRLLAAGGPAEPVQRAADALVAAARSATTIDEARRCDKALRVLLGR